MLNDLKMLLGLAESDTDQDAKLDLLKILLGGIDPPESLQHIIVEAAVIRFNRIGSEGLSSHSVEGENLSFADGDFDGFKDEIQAFLDTQTESPRGRVRFL